MQDDFLMFSADKMIDDMRGGGIATRIAEPLGANETLDY